MSVSGQWGRRGGSRPSLTWVDVSGGQKGLFVQHEDEALGGKAMPWRRQRPPASLLSSSEVQVGVTHWSFPQ